MTRFLLPAVLNVIFVFALCPSGATAGSSTRYAIVVGNNIGTAQAEPLRYAERDARRMSKLLRDIGGVEMENLYVLEGQDPDTLREVLDKLSEKLVQAEDDAVFLFYYSGHADSGWLRMNGKGISVGEIRRRLEQMPAKVRVAIVDACQSGEITRSKGGVVVSPFLEDNAVQVEGLVILTSASAAEPAQESDILMSSYFSHHLMSGMRGPADSSGDGRVSAVEAYDYAYKYTVKETEGTSAGTQHPTFLYALHGEGDIALTSVNEGRARLGLPASMSGTLFFIGSGGQIEAEVIKYRGEKVQVALLPGAYEIRWRTGNTRWITEMELRDGDAVELTGKEFEERKLVVSAEKGRSVGGTEEPSDGRPRPLGDQPLGGGANWENASGNRPQPIMESGKTGSHDGVIGGSKDKSNSSEGPPHDDSKSFARREDARLWPPLAMATSLVLPGFPQGAEGRYGKAAAITGVFLGSLAGGALFEQSLKESDSVNVRAVKITGTTALAYLAFYAYAFAAIDAFYATTKGGPEKPDFSTMKLDLSTSISSALLHTDDSVEMGIGGGLGIGVAVHPNLVIGLRNVAAFRQVGVWNATFGPELRLRAMWLDDLAWSISIGAVVQSSIMYEIINTPGDAEEIKTEDATWSVLPYLAGSLHYFPARSWSLDFGIRSGMAIGTRRLAYWVSQSSGSFVVEYQGGLTWYY